MAMSEHEDDNRGRIPEPRPASDAESVSRRPSPSPSLAARIKLLEADADKHSFHAANHNQRELSPSPSPHRSRSRPRSADSELLAVSSVPTSIPTSDNLHPAPERPTHLPPTPVEDLPDEHTHVPLGDMSSVVASESAPSPVAESEGDTSVASQEQFYVPTKLVKLKRRSSVVSLSRISFSAQLSRLTSLSLPLSEDLSERIRKIATSTEMCAALMGAGNQIGRWIDTAKKVLKGLDAEDDVEWAAQGRESLNEVDAAVKKFSGLMNVYIELIDELQRRPDSDTVESEVLVDIVGAMEATVDGWRSVQILLTGVRDQVETAMEWTELWATILMDIQAELDACQTLVFELEERRHRTMMEENSSSVDIETLQTIMEDNPGIFPVVNGKIPLDVEDSSLLGLFARMQPLRASLDFLPMRLQSFESRAQEVFPTACDELDSRRKQLERKWKKLNTDSDSLKRELGEDRWVAIFRNAGNQASQMLDSIERSMNNLKESVIAWEESGGHEGQDMHKKMENYEAKKMHYGVAIQRTFSIIGKGLSDRFTVNGEIIRLDSSLRARWKRIEDQMWELDQALKDLELDAEALRESITSLNSLDICAGMITPGTSPASSVQPSSPKQNQGRRPSLAAINTRRPPSAIGSNSSSSARRRQQSASTTPPLSPWGSTTPTSSAMQRAYSTPSANGSYSSSSSSRTAETKKPRWNSGAKVDDTQIGHNFKPLNLTMPSPYRKTTPQSTSGSRRDSSSRTSSAMGTRLPLPSPLRSATTPTPQTPGYLRAGSSAAMRRPYLTSPCPASSKPSLRRQSSNTQLNSGGDSSTSMSYSDFMKTSNSSDYGSSGGSTNGSGSGPRINVRPATSMAGRRSSMMTGRQTPAGTRSGAATPNGTGKRCSMPYGSTSGLAWSKEMGAGGKPRWRY